MLNFVHPGHPSRVLFGWGCLAQLPEEIERLAAARVLVLATPGHAALGERAAALLGPRAAGVFARARVHVPAETARAAVDEARRVSADALVAIGGGSTTGLAKAVARETGLPIAAVPTTYAGSEVTPIWGLTDGGVKTTGRDARVLPRTVLYDAELSAALPLALSVTSAINAMAHAAEGLYAPDGNPLVSLMAEEGLRAMGAALPTLRRDLHDRGAREQALYGTWLCGVVLGSVAMGLHHKLCHTLGGSFDLPHAETHTVLLPHALAYNAPAAPVAMERLARALGAPGDSDGGAAARALQSLAASLGAPRSLREIGMPAEGLDRVADLAVRTPYPNPRPLERDALRALLQRAYDGAPALP